MKTAKQKEKFARITVPLLMLVLVIVGAVTAFLVTTSSNGVDDTHKEQSVSFLKPPAPISQVLAARQYIDSNIQAVQVPTPTQDQSEYVSAAFKAVNYYKEVADSPLPYEAYAPEDTSQMVDEVIYRGSNQDELSPSEEQLIFDVKRTRIDFYQLAVNELNRRIEQGGETRYEAEEARLAELASELPFYVPTIRVGNACESIDTTLGCFFNSGEILITPLALKLDEGDGCLLITTIIHETRHYQQFEKRPKTDFVSKVVEDDANQFMRDNTPTRCK